MLSLHQAWSILGQIKMWSKRHDVNNLSNHASIELPTFFLRFIVELYLLHSDLLICQRVHQQTRLQECEKLSWTLLPHTQIRFLPVWSWTMCSFLWIKRTADAFRAVPSPVMWYAPGFNTPNLTFQNYLRDVKLLSDSSVVCFFSSSREWQQLFTPLWLKSRIPHQSRCWLFPLQGNAEIKKREMTCSVPCGCHHSVFGLYCAQTTVSSSRFIFIVTGQMNMRAKHQNLLHKQQSWCKTFLLSVKWNCISPPAGTAGFVPHSHIFLIFSIFREAKGKTLYSGHTTQLFKGPLR